MLRYLLLALLLASPSASAGCPGPGALCQPIPIAVGAPTITSVNLSNNSFTGGAASGTVVGAITVGMSSGSFTGTLALSGTNASSFALSGTNLQTNGVVAAGTYSITITATQAGATGSPFAQAETITGTAAVTCAAATFNGTSSFGATAALSGLNAVGQFTVSLWSNITSFATGEIIIELSANSSTNANSFLLYSNSSGSALIELNAAGGLVYSSFPQPTAGAWHNWVFVIDLGLSSNQILAVYIDGVSQTFTQGGGSNIAGLNTYPLYLMSRGGTVNFEAGSMQDPAIFTSKLTSGNAASLAGGASPTTIAGGAAYYWRLSGTTGTEANLGNGGTAAVTLTGVTSSTGPSPCPTQ
jgi:hypothetical protein